MGISILILFLRNCRQSFWSAHRPAPVGFFLSWECSHLWVLWSFSFSWSSLTWCSLSFSWMNSFPQSWHFTIVSWWTCLAWPISSSYFSNFWPQSSHTFLFLWNSTLENQLYISTSIGNVLLKQLENNSNNEVINTTQFLFTLCTFAYAVPSNTEWRRGRVRGNISGIHDILWLDNLACYKVDRRILNESKESKNTSRRPPCLGLFLR